MVDLGMSEDREVIREYKAEMEISCEICCRKIGFKQKCSPCLEGGYTHIGCIVSMITHVCPKCRSMSDGETYGEDEIYCENCGAIMQSISKKEVRKKLKVITPAEDVPDLYDIE